MGLYARAVRLVRSRADWARIATYCVIAAAAVIAVRNALVYPAIVGYDAQEAIDYAQGLVKDGRLPEGTGSYYTPPGFFAIGGLGIELAERLGSIDAERVGQVVNALAAVGTVLLLLALAASALARAGGPPSRGGRVLRRLPGGDEVRRDVPSRAAVDAALDGGARPRGSAPRASDHRLLVAAALGLTLGLAQLVRAWTLWTVGVVVVVARRRRPDAAERASALLRRIAVVSRSRSSCPRRGTPTSSPRTTARCSGSRIRPSPSGRAVRSGSSSAPGCPRSSRSPTARRSRVQFLPIAYTETWGDYFGVWRWLPSDVGRPAGDVRRELVTMSIVGLPFTLMAVAGWIALLGLAVRHPGRATERQLVALLPLAALAGVLYFATSYPTPDGDTVKGSFMLTAVPAWAACFGFAFDEVRRRYPRGSAAFLLVLAALALVAAPFLLAPTAA